MCNDAKVFMKVQRHSGCAETSTSTKFWPLVVSMYSSLDRQIKSRYPRSEVSSALLLGIELLQCQGGFVMVEAHALANALPGRLTRHSSFDCNKAVIMDSSEQVSIT
jgi:hypothetical protein